MIIAPDIQVHPIGINTEAGITLTIRAAKIIVNGIGVSARITAAD